MFSDKDTGARRAPLSAPLQGALYMIVAAFCFSVMNIAIRYAAETLDPLQIAFFRNVFAFAFMLPWLYRAGFAGLHTERLGAHAVRAVIGMMAMVMWFYSVTLLPLAEAVALNFTVPLFATIGAALILKEVVRARRWSATLVGFAGVLIILRPGFAEVTPVTALPVIAALFMAASSLLVKSLARTESPAAIVMYMNLFLTPMSLVPALFVWRWPGAFELSLGILIGGLAAFAHICLTRAFAKADASAVLPFDYARLPFVALLAFFFFGQGVDIWTWVGAAVIAGSAIYIAHRETKMAREVGTQPSTHRVPQERV
ncbi:MAG: DMT family transporter [Pseudomonadota bacterium]